MKKLLSFLTKKINLTQKGIFLIVLAFSFTVQSQTSGIFESYAIMSVNGGANAFYDLQPASINPDFQGTNFGTFVKGTNTLVLKGGQNKTFKNGGCNILNSSIWYRIFLTGAPSGLFTGITESFAFNIGGSGDQQWEGVSGTTDIIASLPVGNYTLQTYTQADFDGCGNGTHFITNGSNNYNATFSVAAPTATPIEVTATAGNLGPAYYATIKAAFDAINISTHQGAIVISIDGNTIETASAVLNASGIVISANPASSYTSILIKPTNGVARTISGNLAAPLIDLNGADNVTIDGLNTGGNSLTISNLSTAAISGTSTVKFQVDATNNTVTNCSILGSSTMIVGTNGGNIWFAAGALATGNDNNTVSNCNIGPAGANLPTKGVYFSGNTTPVALANSGNLINNNNIFDYFGTATSSAGIYSGNGSTANSFTNNKFYQTAARVFTSGQLHCAIQVVNTTSAAGFNITGNIIGYSASNATGTYTMTGSSGKFNGIFFSGLNAGITSDISSNTITNISLTGVTSFGTTNVSPFAAILLDKGVVTSSSNNIGSQTATGALVFSTTTNTATDVFGIFNNATNDNWTVNSNKIGGITVTSSATSVASIVHGIRAFNGSGATTTATSNLIGGTISNSIQNNCTSSLAQVIGLSTGNALLIATTDTVRNLTATGGTGTSNTASVIGLFSAAGSTGNNIIVQNNIYTLTNTNTTASTVVTGIQFSGAGAANLVERNFIYDIKTSTTATTAEINGIRIAGGTTVFKNNKIAIGAGVTNAVTMSGILEATGTNSIWHNSVYIDGTPTAGAGNSYAFNAQQTFNTRSFRNNIFFNGRSNSGGATGKHYITRVGGSSVNPTGLTSDNNIYFGNGTGSVFGFFNNLDVISLTNWKSVTGQDALSFNSNPRYIDPTNALPDLKIQTAVATEVESGGAGGLATKDFDDITRNVTTPDLGAYEGNYITLDLTPPAFSYTAIPNQNNATAPTVSIGITDVKSGVNIAISTKSRLYYKKCSNSNVIGATNTNSTDGWKYVESVTASTPFSFLLDYGLLNGTAVDVGSQIQYFVVAQDLAATPNVGIGNGLTFASSPASVNLVTSNLPATATQSYIVLMPIGVGGTYTIGNTGAIFQNFTGDCGGLFKVINASNANISRGNVTASVVDDVTGEPNLFQLNVSGTTPGTFSVLVVPNSTTLRTISGTQADGAAAAASTFNQMIGIYGNGRLKVDGRFSGSGRYLLFRNTNAIAANTVPVINFRTLSNPSSALLDLNYAIFEGNNANNSQFAAGIINSVTSTTGTAPISIDNCIIRGATGGTSGSASIGITVNSSVTTNTFTNNLIDNIFAVPVQVYGCLSSTITGNHIYASNAFTTAPTFYFGIHIAGGSGFTINNNYLGGQEASAGGSAMTISSAVDFRGIYIQTASGTVNIQGNTIQNINLSDNTTGTTFYGVHSFSTNTGLNTGTGNTIGHLTDPTKGITVAGQGITFGIVTQAGNFANSINNNKIANISAIGNSTTVRLHAIRFDNPAGGSAAVPQLINGNTINLLSTNSTIPNNILGGTLSSYNFASLAGIVYNGGGNPTSISISDNNISNLSCNGIGVSNTTVVGIETTGGNNTVNVGQVNRNKIWGFENKSIATVAPFGAIIGIRAYDKKYVFSNNMVSLSNGSNTNAVWVYGIMEGSGLSSSGTSEYNYNSVNIAGNTIASGSANSASYNNYSAGLSTDVLRNNIFQNLRTSSGSSTGKHYAIQFTTAPSGYNGNHNNLFTNDPNTLCFSTSDRTLATWRSIGATYDPSTGSISTQVTFVDINIGDLHLASNSSCINANPTLIGTPISITTDYDLETRSATSPTIGADEYISIAYTWDGSSWSPTGVPNINSAVTLNGDYDMNIRTSIDACSLTIGNGSNNPIVTVIAGKYLNIQNDLTINTAATLNILDKGSLVMINDAGVVTNNGSTNVLRLTPSFDQFDYTYWSAPVENPQIGTPLAAWNLSQAYNFTTANFSDTSNDATIPQSNNAGSDTFDDDGNDWISVPSTTPMTAGVGYAVMGNATAGTPNSTEIVTFSGKVNNGSITFPLALSANSVSSLDDYNLVGNPYPSSIKADDFIKANILPLGTGNNISGTLYFWSHKGNLEPAITNPGPNVQNYNNNDYATYNLTGATATGSGSASGSLSAVPNGFIGTGQGFFVEAEVAINLVFKNSFRSKNYSNNQFFRGNNTEQKDRLWLNFENIDNMFSQQLIGYLPETTLDYDYGYDGIESKTQNYVSFYSFMNDSSDTNFKIQSRNTFNENDFVKLGFSSAVSGQSSISIDRFEGVFENQNIYLQDNLLNITHDLKQAPYSFTTNYGTFNDRFILKYQNAFLSSNTFVNAENIVKIAAKNAKISVTSNIDNIKSIQIFDLLGRNIFDNQIINAKNTIIENLLTKNQVLIIKITLETGELVSKKIVLQ